MAIGIIIGLNSFSRLSKTNYRSYVGMYIFAQDSRQQYLGKITANQFDSDSIINDFGSYGSQFSSTSIRNDFSQYGSHFSSYSAYNSFTSSPPIIYSWNGNSYTAQAYLSKNHYLSGPTVDPDGLIAYLENSPYIPPVIPPVSYPDLVPYKPSSWSSEVVISSGMGTNADSSALYENDTICLDWAVLNDSSTNITRAFTTSLYLDGALLYSWSTDSLQSTYYTYVTDYQIGRLTAGTHSIRLVCDSASNIIETNESNNTYTKSVTIRPIYVPPANQAPQLSGGTVSPTTGTSETNFVFSVHYYDTDGDSPSIGRIIIDNQDTFDLQLTSGTASNGTYATTLLSLSSGTHSYYFYFQDTRGGTARLPNSGTYPGPIIGSACDGPGAMTLTGSCGTIGQVVTIAITGQGGLYYKYWVNENSCYDFPNNPRWVMLQDWTTSNTYTWTPTSAGLKTIVVWTASNTINSCTGIVGGTYNVTATGSTCLNATGISLNKNCGTRGDPVLITVASSLPNLKFKYWVNNNSYCTSPNSPSWQLLQDWTTINSFTWTPPRAGLYTIVVWTATDTNNPRTGIVGLSYDAQ